jgi:membrane protease YdiL (CAAX protease family)
MTNTENLRFISAIVWCVAGFGSYYFLSKNRVLISRFGSLCKIRDTQEAQVILQRMLGLFFLGMVSVLIIVLLPGEGLQEFGLTFHFAEPPPWWSWLLIPLILIMGFFAARKPVNLKQYPQIRTRTWTPALVAVNGITWLLFLIGYELLFRGFVLYASLGIMEAGPAIALNATVYAFAHFYKGPGETFGAIPAGILFCYLTLLTGNIWSAVVLHSVMALSIEWFSLKAHPDMGVTRAH